MQPDYQKIKTRILEALPSIALGIFVLAAAIFLASAFAPKAKAGPVCGFGGQAGIVADTKALAGGSVFCELPQGIFVLGAFADYNWALGDLSKAGLDKEIALGLRGGVMVNPHTQVGVLWAWSRVSGGSEDIDGQKYGPFVKFKLSDAPGLYGQVDGTLNTYKGEEVYQVMGRLLYQFDLPSAGAPAKPASVKP